MEILNLKAIPIVHDTNVYHLNKKELNAVKKTKYRTPDKGFYLSETITLLENKTLSSLKKFIIKKAEEYVRDILEIKDKISRLKVNSVIKQPEHMLHGWHKDQPDEDIKIAIYYLNTTNGYTLLEDGTKVSSVANRLVMFNNTIVHTCVSQTDVHRRVVININYY